MTRQEADVDVKEENVEADANMLNKTTEEEEEEDEFIPRWRTKVFAIECVRRLITVLAPYPQHFDLSLARQAVTTSSQPSDSKDYLVFSLGELIRLAFSAASSDIETMRPVGVYTMKDIVEVKEKNNWLSIFNFFFHLALLKIYRSRLSWTFIIRTISSSNCFCIKTCI